MDIQRRLFFLSVVHSARCVGGLPHVVNLHKIQLVHSLGLVHTLHSPGTEVPERWGQERKSLWTGFDAGTFPGTGPGERSDAVGQLRTGFYCRFIAAFLPSSLPPSRPECMLSA